MHPAPSATPFDADLLVRDPLEDCVVPGSNPRAYKLSYAYAAIEGTTAAQAGNKWSYLKKNFPGDITHKSGTAICVHEAQMMTVLKTMKETENKSLALRLRGVDVHEGVVKVREIVLHSEGHEIRIKVLFCAICIGRDYLSPAIHIESFFIT